MKKNYVIPLDLLNKNEKFDNKKYYNLRKLLEKDNEDNLKIPVAISENEEKFYVDFRDISGIFVGGETGSGKSVFIDSMIISLLMKNTKDTLKLLLIDPNRVELNSYNGIDHLLTNVISDRNMSVLALKKIIEEIESRNNLLSASGFRNIENYNEKCPDPISHIVIVIDESAEVMEEDATKEIMKKILMDGRRAGIHLVLATNAYFEKYFDKEFINLFSYVLSFDLASSEQAKFIKIKDSEWLNAAGEALVRNNGYGVKIQTPYIDDEEINKVINYIKNNK